MCIRDSSSAEEEWLSQTRFFRFVGIEQSNKRTEFRYRFSCYCEVVLLSHRLNQTRKVFTNVPHIKQILRVAKMYMHDRRETFDIFFKNNTFACNHKNNLITLNQYVYTHTDIHPYTIF